MLDKHNAVVVPSDEEKQLMSELMLAFIMPNEPKTDDEKAAFEKAVVYQIEHEKTLEEQLGNETLPQGITSFAIGHFSATLDSSYQQPYLTRKNICPFAYSALLRAGLLYHGMQIGDDVPWLSSQHFSGRL